MNNCSKMINCHNKINFCLKNIINTIIKIQQMKFKRINIFHIISKMCKIIKFKFNNKYLMKIYKICCNFSNNNNYIYKTIFNNEFINTSLIIN